MSRLLNRRIAARGSQYTEKYLQGNVYRLEHGSLPITPKTFLSYNLSGKAKDYASGYIKALMNDLVRVKAEKTKSLGGATAYLPAGYKAPQEFAKESSKKAGDIGTDLANGKYFKNEEEDQNPSFRSRVVSALKSKTAELDALDQSEEVSQKKVHLEDAIDRLQEGIALLDEWENFKNSEWSGEVKSQLADLDGFITEIPPDINHGEEPGITDEVTVISNEDIPEDEIVDSEENVLNPEIQENSDFETHGRTASLKGAKMPISKSLMSGGRASALLKKRIASKNSIKTAMLNRKRAAAIRKEAQVRVAAAWTIAKTMLPTAPASVQKEMAQGLLSSRTKVLTAALRQTAKNAAYRKVCEDLASVHSLELNDPNLMEKAADLAKEKTNAEKELKGEPKNAGNKKADDRKFNGPQPPKYDEGKREEPTLEDGKESKVDAGTAGERPADSVDTSKGDEIIGKVAHGKNCKGCAKCKMAEAEDEHDSEEVPEGSDSSDNFDISFGDADEDHDGFEFGGDAEEVDDEQGKENVEQISEEEKLEDKVHEVEESIDDLKEAIEDESNEEIDVEAIEKGDDDDDEEEELDLEEIFNPKDVSEKVSSLSNDPGDEDLDIDISFEPDDAADLEHEMDSYENFFASHNQASALDDLMSRTAANVDLTSTKEFYSSENDDRDADTDHETDILSELVESCKPEDYNGKRSKQDAKNDLKEPKAASKKAKVLKKIKTASGGAKKSNQSLANLIFLDEDQFQG